MMSSNSVTASRGASRTAAIFAVASLTIAGLNLGAASARAETTVSETRTVTANLFVGAKDTPIRRNAYVTNPAAPPISYPDAPVINNARLEIRSDGTRLVTIPIVNTTFGVVSLPKTSVDGKVDVVASTTTKWATWNGPAQRISAVTLDITRLGEGPVHANFSPAKEYANFFLYRGYKTWDLNLDIVS